MKQQAPVLKPYSILAKSFEPNKWKGSYSLVGHTDDVVNAVSTLIDVLGHRTIEQFGLQCSLSKLKATVRLAAYIHDWGKANHHFQGVVRAKIKDAYPKRFLPNNPQIIRHEVASMLLAWEFREWLEQGEGDFLTALAAAGGHHLKLGGKKGECTDELGEIRKGSGDDRLFLYVSQIKDGKLRPDPRFRGLLKYGVKKLGLPKKFSKELKKKILEPKFSVWSIRDIKNKRREIQDFLTDNWRADTVFLSVVKSLLVCGDAIGSAIPNQSQNNGDKITISSYIQREVLCTLDEDKLQRVIDASLDGNELRPFQIQLAKTTTRVTLARAGCGTGKTLGAYNWARSKAIGRKLIFGYPTTGTSTEGFLDYVHNQLDSVLLHSRANVDLAMATTGEENEAGEGNNEGAIKLESFKAWGKESIVCTVDTVLGWLQCNRRPIYCFPAIASSAFVFDEVHCYDEKLFGALLRFLEVVKAPILLMS
ncbi:MAG: CRISPR-associated endonuclease Cas3'', partial [Xenococcus sp. (in: cyanobacteria)]